MLGFEVLETVDGEIDAALGEGFVDFLREQAFAADVCEPSVLHDVAGGADLVLLEHVHAAQHGAEADLRRARKARVCTSASGEARVPTRSGRLRRCGPS